MPENVKVTLTNGKELFFKDAIGAGPADGFFIINDVENHAVVFPATEVKRAEIERKN